MGFANILQLENLQLTKPINIIDQQDVAEIRRQISQRLSERRRKDMKTFMASWRHSLHEIKHLVEYIRDTNKEKTVPELDELIRKNKMEDPEFIELIENADFMESIIRNHVPTVDTILGKPLDALIKEYDSKIKSGCAGCKLPKD